ncbi:Uracil catabolism protein 4 [Psilocybe cubensis]|uniref:Uracil catabolism protein 4 n=2 Tax=Psilocybe cubensis TaxID=181762 RepID=A0ACB8GHF7_PSICU|nr:Uracil catabolism protein 4 [Psilocybe cubensis]KAH9474885.1 Uracil catabolism protein 4 [Psilocybe cubensis]
MNLGTEIPASQTAIYLRTLPAIRERCGRIHALAQEGKLEYFEYHPEKEVEVARFCVQLMKRDYGDNYASINPHGRWRHLDSGAERIKPLIEKWAAHSTNTADIKEQARRTIDLFVVSVLLDAGAGNAWSYKESSTGLTFSRSEGLGVASVHMFESGIFSSDPEQPYKVDAIGLEKVTAENTAAAMQVSVSNPMVGIEGRASLLVNLGKALKSSPEFFGADGRPGNIIDFLEKESKLDGEIRVVPIAALWQALVDGLNPIWPSRISLAGVSLGDVWPCPSLKASIANPQEGDDLVPFHKLTMWLTYSLVEVLEKILKWHLSGLEDMTGLPEYRNGGLLVDLGVLTLKPNALPKDPKSGLPHALPTHPAIVEWRAMTVIELDRIADLIRTELGLVASQLSLAQVLEAATWKGGREIAKVKRPDTGGPPIEIVSDGTIF